MQWFRWYQGTVEDTKMRLVARHASVTVCHAVGVWASLLEDASKPEHRGICVRDSDYIAAALDLDPDQVKKILEAMQVAGMISMSDGIEIARWKERQFEIDIKDPTAAERQRRHRAKTKRHGGVTDSKHLVTPQSTDTDTETEKKQEGGAANAPPAPGATPVKRDLGSSALAKASPKPSRATRLPADFEVPEGWIMSAGEARERHGMPPINLPLEAERFVNHFASSSGKNAAKLDWRRAFVNWCTSDKTQGAPRGNGRAPPQGTNGLAGAVGSVVQKYRDEEDAKRRTTEN